MSLRLPTIGQTSVPVNDGPSSQNAQGPLGPHGHHPHHHPVHHAQKRARSGAKRKRGSDSADGSDESAASEELQMMLNEHLQKQNEFVMRVAERNPGDRGGSSSDGRDPRDNDDGAVSRPAKRLSSGKRFLRGTDGAVDTHEAHAAAESALLHAREAQAEANRKTSSTYLVLAAMRDFLSVPSATAHSEATLAEVRKRLIEAVETPTKRAPAQQESINLLLPLNLISLKLPRTDAQRALAVAKINSLLDRRRSDV